MIISFKINLNIQTMSKKKLGKKVSKKKKLIEINSQDIQTHLKNINRLNVKRLNCEIPKELHNWLNVYVRSNESDYKSITEAVIDLINNFAVEHGFMIEKVDCKCE